MANGRRPQLQPHPLLRQRIVELYERLNERGKPPDMTDVQTIAWILGELERCGILDFTANQQSSQFGGIFGELSRIIGLSPTVIAFLLFALAFWIGEPFFTFLSQFIPFLR